MKLSDFFESMKGWTPVEPASIPAAPAIPDPNSQVSGYLRTTLPLPMTYQPDTLKQHNRPGMSSFRIAPLPPNALPTLNSASGGVVNATVSTVVADPNLGTLTITSPKGSNIPSSATRLAQNLGQLPDGSSRFAQTGSGLSYRSLTNPLTATDAGASATINIAAFTMRTSSKGDIAISSGSVTVLSYATLYYIYYDDATLAGGSVTFNATTTQATALLGAGRFFVGSIVTPKAGAPDTIGSNDSGVGAQGGNTLGLAFSSHSTQVLGNGAVANPLNARDGDFSTFAALTVTGNSGTNQAFLNLLNPPYLFYPTAKTITLYVKRKVTNTLNGSGIIGRISLINQATNSDVQDLETYVPGVGAPVGVISLVVTPTMISLLANGQIQVGASIGTAGSQTSGAMEIDIYESWITIS
jgi:hypothetical protein